MQNIHYYNDTFIKETLSAWHSSKLSKYTNLRGLTMFYWLANLQTFCLSQESVWTTLWLSILCRVLLTQGFVLVGPFWASQFLLNHRAGTHPLWVSTLSSFPGSLNCRGGLGEGLPGARKEHRFSVFKVKCNFWGLISFCLFHPHFCPVHSAWLMKIQPLFQSLPIPSFLPSSTWSTQDATHHFIKLLSVAQVNRHISDSEKTETNNQPLTLKISLTPGGETQVGSLTSLLLSEPGSETQLKA